MMVTAAKRKAALREIEIRPGTSEIKTKTLLEIIEEMEARTREALDLTRELKEFFRSSRIATINTVGDTEESTDNQSRIFHLPDLQGTGGEHG